MSTTLDRAPRTPAPRSPNPVAASLTRIGAVVLKEFRHLRRDPRIVAMVLLMPVVQLLLFAYAVSFDVRHVPTVVLDQDRTPASRTYVASYTGGDLFDVTREVSALPEIDTAFENGRARVAVVVPAGFSDALARSEKAPVTVLVDGSETNTGRIASTYANALNAQYAQRLVVSWADRQGMDAGANGALEPRLRVWYNPDLRSTVFLVPGLMVVVMLIVTVQQTAVSLVRERDLGTAEQMRVSPLTDPELMLGKLLPWTLLAFVDAVAITLIGVFVFDVPLRGSIPLLAVTTGIFTFAALALGLLVSALAPSLEVANQVALLIAFLPGFLLSGFAFPLDSIPRLLQWISYAFPGRYMVEIARGVFLKGAGLAELWPPLAQMSVYAVVLVTLAVLAQRRRAS